MSFTNIKTNKLSVTDHIKIKPVTERYELPNQTIQNIKSMTPNFGFNGLGELVFKRTYSRGGEDWADVVVRVIQGVLSIRKDHYTKNALKWKDSEWDTFASEMAESMFKMEWLPPGRGLWMMGTDFAYTRGSMALSNCGAVDTLNDIVHSAEWAMDALMNGVGVGFSTSWKGECVMPDKNDFELFVIPDSREGWVESIIILMSSYIESIKYGKHKYPKFDYSQVRAKGLPIKGFGGTSSGPEPLAKLHVRLESYLNAMSVGRLVDSAKSYKEFKNEDGTSEWKEIDIEVDKEYNHTRFVADVFNAIGACVVAGNVRRSAEISLGDVHDKTFIDLKNYDKNPERSEIGWMSNNSVTLDANHDFEDFTFIPEMAKRIIDNGEPGIINLYNIQKYGRYGKDMHDDAYLVNPCVTDDTWIMTDDGSKQVKDLINTPFKAIVNSEKYDCHTGFFHTGKKEVFKLCTKEGFNIKATADHKILSSNGDWVELKDLIPGDTIVVNKHDNLPKVDSCNNKHKEGWLIGSLYGDGTFWYRNDKPSSAYLCFWGEYRYNMQEQANNYLDAIGCYKQNEMTGSEYKGKISIPNNALFDIASKYIQQGKNYTDEIEKQPLSFQSGLLQGWFDADGSVMGSKTKGYSVRLSCTNNESLIRAQRMLTRLGVYSKIYENRRNEGDYYLPDNKGEGGVKMYHCKAVHELIISRKSMFTFNDQVGFTDPGKSDKLNSILDGYTRKPYTCKFTAEVTHTESVGAHHVYDATVNDVHAFDANGLYVHNCSEIQLCSFELCNLAEVFPNRCDNVDVFNKALEFATFYSSTVALLPTHRSETNSIVAKNRRIGVSISAIAQWASFTNKSTWGEMNYTRMTRMLRNGYKIVKDTNEKLAKSAGVPPSIRVTTVKPSGSISLLAGATPGVHYPTSRYSIRRVRIADDSPLIPCLVKANVPHEKDTYSDGTLVFEFVIDNGNVRPCEDVSPWEQFSLVAMMQRCWSDNMVSATIYFDKIKDAPDVEKMLAMYIPVLKSVSMLPHSNSGYAQMPYEKITKEQYEERLNSYGNPDYDSLTNLEPEGEKFCTNDSCTL
ncbi:MAG: LAGLIDADG family homing endonuclease [Promethearchaeota archaeon]|jgi:ribonucleotide reductase alpha subunit